MKAALLLPELSVYSTQSEEKSEYSWSPMQLLACCQRGAAERSSGISKTDKETLQLHPHSSLLLHQIPSVLVHGHLQNCIKIQAGWCLVQLSVGPPREAMPPTPLGLWSSISPSSQCKHCSLPYGIALAAA